MVGSVSLSSKMVQVPRVILSTASLTLLIEKVKVSLFSFRISLMMGMSISIDVFPDSMVALPVFGVKSFPLVAVPAVV